MLVVFRVDASMKMGTGHVMRCLTLADALRNRGLRCHFICRAHQGNMIAAIRQRGYTVTELPAGATVFQPLPSADVPQPAHAGWLGCDWRHDADQTLNEVQAIKPDLLVIDHYAIDIRWEKILRSHVRRIMVIDDLADRSHECDFLLDHNWFGDDMSHRYLGLIPEHCIIMLGPQYALLRPEYEVLRSLMPPRDVEVRRVLVFLGGSDPTNETSKVIVALKHPELMHLLVDVVIGANHPDPLGIVGEAEARHGTFVHRDLPSLAGLMMRADLMISGGGVTTWERMCLGLPTVVICIAENQVEMNHALSRGGYIELLGGKNDVDATRVAESVSAVIESRGALIKMSKRSSALVSGDGASRVCDVLLRTPDDRTRLAEGHASQPSAEALKIRHASVDDGEMLFEWRNNTRTRKYTRNPAALSRLGHMNWFTQTLVSERSKLLIAMHGDHPVGCVRFDIDDKQAEVSIYLDPARHGRGWGGLVLSQAMAWMHSVYPSVTLFSADVLAENLASVKLFQRCGYSLKQQKFEFRRIKE
jgi:UDP-2,4-diacetamido-2,4,6-trideoxy-beta-L-altropyranose hydrolase